MALDFPVITICGSMRYFEQMLEAAKNYTQNGWIVLMPFDASYTGGVMSDGTKIMLDKMHLAKIEMSVAILVVGSHRGESTTREISYAESRNKVLMIWP